MANEYNKTLEACTSLATISSMQNKLNKIYTSTEDPKLQSYLNPVLDNLVQTQKAVILRKISSQKVQCNLSQSPFRELAVYCRQAISSQKPQWQIIAEQHGWSK